MKKEKKLLVLNKSNLWWHGRSPEHDWATQDKDGNWWRFPGSEFAEKKIERKKNMSPCGFPPTFNFKKNLIMILLAAALGISLALNIIGYLLN